MLAALKARDHRLTVATGKCAARPGRSAGQGGARVGCSTATRTADETAGKPHPRMLLELMHEFSVEPERTLMIGDTTHDLQMATNAGAACVGVSYGARQSGTFASFEPLHIPHSVGNLSDWLSRHA